MDSTGTQRYPGHAARCLLALMLMFILLPLSTPAAASSPGQWRVPGPTTKLYIGQFARLTAQIPAFWTASPASDVDYSGPDGYVRSVPLGAATLDDACTQAGGNVSRATISETRRPGHSACLISAPANAATGRPAAMTLVTAHPHPFTTFGTQFGYVALVADPDHFPAIVATLSFLPDRVTPLAYTQSVIDLAEARSPFRADVDWARIRRAAAEGVADWDTARETIGLLISLLGIAGDNHSLYLSPELNADQSVIRQDLPSGRRDRVRRAA